MIKIRLDPTLPTSHKNQTAFRWNSNSMVYNRSSQCLAGRYSSGWSSLSLCACKLICIKKKSSGLKASEGPKGHHFICSMYYEEILTSRCFRTTFTLCVSIICFVKWNVWIKKTYFTVAYLYKSPEDKANNARF